MGHSDLDGRTRYHLQSQPVENDPLASKFKLLSSPIRYREMRNPGFSTQPGRSVPRIPGTVGAVYNPSELTSRVRNSLAWRDFSRRALALMDAPMVLTMPSAPARDLSLQRSW